VRNDVVSRSPTFGAADVITARSMRSTTTALAELVALVADTGEVPAVSGRRASAA
jgi:hypothetical protein